MELYFRCVFVKILSKQLKWNGHFKKWKAFWCYIMILWFIDNNFFVPRIIGSSVQLNALFSIIAVLIGGALCGVGGMFLSIPFMAIFKVICDHVDHLKPWGMLLGDAEQARWRLLRIPSMKAVKKRESSQVNIKKKAG